MIALATARRLARYSTNVWTWSRLDRMNRTFRTTTVFAVQTFVQRENETMYSVIKANPECANTLMRLSLTRAVESPEFENVLMRDWQSDSPENVAEAFNLISVYGPQNGREITEEAFNNICDAVKAKCSEMKDEHLLGALRDLSRWPITRDVKARNFDMWAALDAACTPRTKGWTRAELLLAADHWYRLGLVRSSKFMVACMRRLCRKPHKLTAAQLVQTMFYLNAQRRHAAVAEAFEMEHALESCAERLSLEDLALVAAGYFKTERKIRSERLLGRMVEVAGEGAAAAPDVLLAALMKVMRYSLPLSMIDQLYAMQERVLPHVPRFSLMTCTHVVLAGTNAQVLHERLVLAVAERFAREAGAARIKDLERMALALGLFGVAPPPDARPCIFEALQRELRDPARAKELAAYGRCLPRVLYFLSLCGVYPLDLLQRAMHPDYLDQHFGDNPHAYELELLALDMAVSLERPDLDVPRLTPRARTIIAKRFRRAAPTLGRPERGALADKLLGQLQVAAVEAAGGAERAAARHVLPHHARAPVVVRVDPEASRRAGRVVCLPLPEDLLQGPPPGADARPAPRDGALWCTLVAAGWNSYVHGDGNGRFVGGAAALLRQLPAVGYRPVVVPWYEWKKVPTTGRADFVRQLLREELDRAAAAAATGAL
ncbi:hypothetical protein R5R35_014187 [Gryllus longicercus]|uniref:RAP domain-containing protein n=1 Tax=Gryllus longicercus TaxID=2509291 RepID=A0AAN9ZBK4_9ORTH